MLKMLWDFVFSALTVCCLFYGALFAADDQSLKLSIIGIGVFRALAFIDELFIKKPRTIVGVSAVKRKSGSWGGAIVLVLVVLVVIGMMAGPSP